MANLLEGILANALQGVAPEWSRTSLQGCTGNPRHEADGFTAGELMYTTEQLGLLLGAISERLSLAIGGRHLRTTDTGCLVEDIRKATEALVWGEKHDDGLFDLFCERQALASFVAALLAPCVPQPVRVQLWQTLSILVLNARRSTSFCYLLSGGHLNTLLAGDPDLRNEETLAYFVAFMKSLSLRLDGETALLVLDRRPEAAWAGGFPLFAQTVRLATHRDHMICTAARAALLNLLRIEHPEVRSRAAEAACQLLVPSIARSFCVSWAAASAATIAQDQETTRVALETEDDLFGFLNDLLSLDVAGITEALVRCVVAKALLPLFACLAPPVSYPKSPEADDLGAVGRQDSLMDVNDERCLEQEQQLGQFVGSWFYGGSGANFQVCKGECGQLLFTERSPAGRLVEGVLHPFDLWHEGDIRFSDGNACGRIRLRFIDEQKALLSNFKKVGERRWGPDTFAHQSTGTWFYTKEGNCFQISMSDSGQLSYKEYLSSSRHVSGMLISQGEWLQTDLVFSGGEAYGTVRLRRINQQNMIFSNFRKVESGEWGPTMSARKAAQDSALSTTFGPAAAEIAQAVSSMVLGLEPAQQGLVGAVIDKVLGGSSTGFVVGATAPQLASTPQEASSQDEVPGQQLPSTAVALRAMASCIRCLANHKNIVVPLAKVLLWPSVPSALAAAVYAPTSDSAQLAAGAFGLVASASAAEPLPRSQQHLASVPVANPFRAGLLALLGGAANATAGPAPPEAPLAAWVLRELREALPPTHWEDVGLLPPCAFRGVRGSPQYADEALLVEWLRQWHGPLTGKPQPRLSSLLMSCKEESSLPEHLVGALRVHAGLSRAAHAAVAGALLHIVGSPQAQAALWPAKGAAIGAMREAGDALWLAACQDVDYSDGRGGMAFGELVGGFLEEWAWTKNSDACADLLNVASSTQCLLQCASSRCEPPTSHCSSSTDCQSRRAARTFLMLRELCFSIVALEESSCTGKDHNARLKSPRGECPLDAQAEQDARGLASLLGRIKRKNFPTIPCVGPWGGVYAQGHALVQHPSLVVVVEPSRIDDGGGVHVCVPSWRATALDPSWDPRSLTIQVMGPLVGDDAPVNKGSVEEVELRFSDAEACCQAFKHLRGSKVRESRRLLAQLRTFIDRSVGQVTLGPFSTS